MTRQSENFRQIIKKLVDERVEEEISGKVMYVGPYTVVSGIKNQSQLKSKYQGLQCTTMALTAIIYWKRFGYPYQFTPQHIHSILTEGNDLHTLMRDQIKVSKSRDGMVGLYDIPYNRLLNVGVMFDCRIKVKLVHEGLPVLSSGKHPFLQNLHEYLKNYCPDKLAGFLITIKCYSYAIIRLPFGAYAFFDSHGHILVKGKSHSTAACAVFCPSLTDLIDLICGMHGQKRQVDIAPLISEQRRICTRVLTKEECVPHEDEMDNPYISLMAH